MKDESELHRMIYDYLGELKLSKSAKAFKKECGTDMDPKFNRRCLKRIFNEWERLDQKRYVIPTSDIQSLSYLNRVVII